MAKEVIVKAEQIKHRSTFTRKVKLALLILLLFLSSMYITLGFVYEEGKFTVLLDDKTDTESGLAVFDDLKNGKNQRRLEAEPIKKMDNISYKWLPANINKEKDGSHNGDNYIAYSFYVENQGDETLSYWYEITVDGVIKDVDDAIRVRIYKNDDYITYAKIARNGKPEPLTTPFKIESNTPIKGQSIIIEKREGLKKDERDRFTIVIWIEGDDPECLDNLIGGAIKMHMTITEDPSKAME